MAQILQRIVQFVEIRVARLPQVISRREQIRSKRAESQQVIATVHDHVNRQVVSREEMKIGSNLVPQSQPLPFEVSFE